ncbi:hypothetical protein V5O48_016582, partial [Marasmius crinis-equi]
MASIHPIDTEKEKTDRIEDPNNRNSHRELKNRLPEPGTPERIATERKLVRKLDRRVLPTIIVIYAMNNIDRSGITTARLQGLEDDLHLTSASSSSASSVRPCAKLFPGIQYSVILSAIYVTYCPAQVPSNMILNHITRPSLYIGACVVAWGLTSAMTGLTRNFGGIMACRIFLGLPEAAFYPGAIYLLSRWYTKKELAFRSAILYGGLMISNAFGALMAAGILAGMEGKRGIRAWRWLFFIEVGRAFAIQHPIVDGLCAIWLLPDYPCNTRWLSPVDCRLAQARLSDDAGEADQDNESDSPFHGLKLAITDPKVLLFALMSCVQLLGLGFSIFFPTLTATLGFSTTVTLVLAAPPWILATALCYLNAWHADRTGERYFHIVGWWWGTILGYIIALSTNYTAARYVSLFLMTFGYVGAA